MKKDKWEDMYLEPHTIDKDTWFYISKSGKTIEFVRQVRSKHAGRYMLTDMFKVPAIKLLEAITTQLKVAELKKK